MLPLLEYAADGEIKTLSDTRKFLASVFELSSEELAELLPSGRQKIFSNRISWSKSYLTGAQLLESIGRGDFRITARGTAVLSEKLDNIDKLYLEKFPEFVAFLKPPGKPDASEPSQNASDTDATQTPTELMSDSYQALRREVTDKLLENIKANSPDFFEHLIIELLVKMGYGGSFHEAGKATRKTADEGIDGIIKQDRLGLSNIYLQAKRWESPVGRPELHKFVGALHGQMASKGVFITTSRFTREAVDYAERIEKRVVLIDGQQLADLMFEYDLGVSEYEVYRVKRVDSDFFEDDYV
jgi:restriction system protein